VRQYLMESLLLATGGGLVGLGVGVLVFRIIARSGAAELAMLRDSRLDLTVLAFTSGITIIAALAFGTAPAIRAARVNAGDVLKETAGRGSSAGRAQSRMLNSAVVVQVSLALVLLLGSGLAIRSLARLLAVDPGFRPEHVLTMQLSVRGAHYSTPASQLAFHDALLERLRATPGIEAAGTASGVPFTSTGNSSPFRIVGHEPGPGEPKRHANMWHAGGDYFRAAGIQLIAGRTFTDADAQGAEPVSIIDEALAKQFFPNEDPIGKQIVQGMGTTIIGVVRSVKKEDLAAPDKASVYYPYRQTPWAIGTMTVVVRTSLPMSAAAGVLRSAVRELDPNLPMFDIVPMRERIDRSLGTRRLAMRVLTGFAALSLVLAVLGIYGVLSYGVAQRTQELGIRMALGAQPGDVIRLVVRNGLALVGIGLALGTAAFVGLGRVLAALLYGVGPRDPLTLLGGIALLMLAALLACWLPARRATRVDPVRALRAE
jgi:putative ABC transport system permease protein